MKSSQLQTRPDDGCKDAQRSFRTGSVPGREFVQGKVELQAEFVVMGRHGSFTLTVIAELEL